MNSLNSRMEAARLRYELALLRSQIVTLKLLLLTHESEVSDAQLDQASQN